jgi:hypothetical protein
MVMGGGLWITLKAPRIMEKQINKSKVSPGFHPLYAAVNTTTFINRILKVNNH